MVDKCIDCMKKGKAAGIGPLVKSGFVQTLESPGIKMLRFPGLESPGKPWKSPGILK